ncbi:hypothetical protein KGP36_04055 [Patescibacteria group bacterium]|nr:hypothetical protein [Patescibacteria group bacterium]
MKTPILGQTYVARSVNAAASRMVNLFPEFVPDGGKEPAFLMRAPGLTLKVTFGAGGPIQALHALGNWLYVVAHGTLYKVDKNNSGSQIGVLTVDNLGPVSIADNGQSLFIACGSTAWVYNTVTSVLSQITTSGFPGASTVTFMDGYFVYNVAGTVDVYSTDYFPATGYDAAMVGAALATSDNVVAVKADHDEIWVFKERSTQVWYNQGGTGFPFSVIQGSTNEIGCAAAFSVTKLDNTLFWLGRDINGQGIVYRANGYAGERVSTHAVEWHIQSYSTISDAIGYGYQQDGHTFYVLTFPSGNATWVYDVSTGMWHERGNFSAGVFGRHLGNCHAFFNGLNYVGDYQNGNLYVLDSTVYQDNGAIQKWLRSWRALPTDQDDLSRAFRKNLGIPGVDFKRTAHHSLQLDCESGVGLSDGTSPQVMLRWSDDGGHTWSQEHWASMGAVGNYGQRVIWRRLGMTRKIRDRVYEVSGTDAVKIAIIGAELQLSGTDA